MDLNQLKAEMPPTVNVVDAAKILGMQPPILRLFLLENKFSFGSAIRMKHIESYINTKHFIKYVEGE